MKNVIGGESSKNLGQHSAKGANGELWLWGPQKNGSGDLQWGVNEGRCDGVYCFSTFYTRKQAEAQLQKMRRERAKWKLECEAWRDREAAEKKARKGKRTMSKDKYIPGRVHTTNDIAVLQSRVGKLISAIVLRRVP